jgi:hypothetical protein
MHSTLTLKEADPPEREADPHDVFLLEPEVIRALRAHKPSSKPAQAVINGPSAPQAHVAADVSPGVSAPPVDTTFRATAADKIQVSGRDQPAISRWAKRVFMGLLALCSAVAAAAWQHYGDTAKQVIANLVPPFVLASSPPVQKPPLAEQPGSPVIQTAAADQEAAQPAAPAQPSEAAAPAATASSPESTQLLQSMTRDVATMGQEIEQLKASIAQLKAGQEQMARDMAKSSEAKSSEAKVSAHSVQPRISAPPPRSAAAPARRPRPAYSPAQAVAAPALPPPPAAVAPAPLQPEPPPPATAQELEPVVRPPMPVR